MRFFTLLSFVSLALALATKPIERDVEEDTKHPSIGDVKYSEIDVTDAGSIKVSSTDIQERGVGSLEKRLDGIRVPNGNADPQALLMGGVTVSFIMIGKWVSQGGNRVYTYVCNGLKFSNPTSRDKVVTVVANGVTLLRNQPLPSRLAAQIGAPTGGYGNEVSITIGNSP